MAKKNKNRRDNNSKLVKEYNRLMKDSDFRKFAEDFSLDPRTEYFEEDFQTAKDLYEQDKAMKQADAAKQEKAKREEEIAEYVDDIKQVKKSDVKKQDTRTATSTPKSKNASIKKYKNLMNDNLFRQLADQHKLSPKSSKFESDLADVEKIYNQVNEEFLQAVTSVDAERDGKDKKSTKKTTDTTDKTDKEKKSAESKNGEQAAKTGKGVGNVTPEELRAIMEKAQEKKNESAMSDLEVTIIDDTGKLSKKKVDTYIDAEFTVSDKNPGTNQNPYVYWNDIMGSNYNDEYLELMKQVQKNSGTNQNSVDDLKKNFNDAVEIYQKKQEGNDQKPDGLENRIMISKEIIEKARKAKLEKEQKRRDKKPEDREVEVIFDSKLGMYILREDGQDIAAKMLTRAEKRNYAKKINKLCEGSYMSDVGKYVDPNVYELLKDYDKKNRRADGSELSVEYLRALKDKNPKSLLCDITYDLRGIDKAKKIKFLDRFRIKKFAKQHEEMDIAEVYRDPRSKRFAKWVAILASAGLAIGGAIGIANKLNENNLLDTGSISSTSNEQNNNTTKDDESVKEEIDNNNKDEISIENTIDNIDENEETQNGNENNNTGDSVENNSSKEENQIAENEMTQKQPLEMGKEVKINAEELFYTGDGAKPTCNVERFMKNNPDAKWILSRVAVKTENGYILNTTSKDVSVQDLIDKYGEDAVKCNFRVEVPGGTYVDIGWTDAKNVEAKEEVKKENPWQVEKNSQVGKSGVSKETEDTVTQTLKRSGIDASFER